MAGREGEMRRRKERGEDAITNKTDLISTPSPLIPPPPTPHIAGKKGPLIFSPLHFFFFSTSYEGKLIEYISGSVAAAQSISSGGGGRRSS